MTNDISVVRGTTASFNITLRNASGQLYTLQSGESLVFGVKSDPDNTAYDIVKSITLNDRLSTGVYVLTLTPGHTEDLSVGQYYYDIGLKGAGNAFYNVVECSYFFVKPNITDRTAGA